jgi:hypoxanthine-guanine phosphoribosyltransferase
MEKLLNDKNKIINFVEVLKNKKPEGGINFFDKIDEFIRDPKNVEIIYHIIDKIRQDQGSNFNLILSGKFGDWVHNLIKTRKIKISGIVILVSGSLRSDIKNSSFQVICGNEDRVYNTNFILLDDSYYSGSTKKEIEKHLSKYKAKILKTYVIYDGSFTKRSDIFSVYRYYDYYSDDIMPIKKLLGILNSINELNIPYDVIENQIMRGQIRNIRELLREIQILKQKFQKSGGDKVNIISYGYKREYEKKVNNYKKFVNEWYKEPEEQSFTYIKFWYKYKHEGRDSMRNLLKGKEIEFHTKTKNIGVYRGGIIGLLPLLSKKNNDIIILFDTRKYGTLEVDNEFPIIIRN